MRFDGKSMVKNPYDHWNDGEIDVDEPTWPLKNTKKQGNDKNLRQRKGYVQDKQIMDNDHSNPRTSTVLALPCDNQK